MTIVPIRNRNPRLPITSYRSCGQVTIEYFILFAVVALLTLAGLTTVDDQVRTGLQNFFRAAANDIAH